MEQETIAQGLSKSPPEHDSLAPDPESLAPDPSDGSEIAQENVTPEESATPDVRHSTRIKHPQLRCGM